MARKPKTETVATGESPATETVNPSVSPADIEAAESALSQAETPTVEIVPAQIAPPPSSLWLPGGAGEFSAAIVSKRLHDAEADIGRLKMRVDNSPTRISGTATKGGVFWEGHSLRPCQNNREKTALALAKAARNFRTAYLAYSKECQD